MQHGKPESEELEKINQPEIDRLEIKEKILCDRNDKCGKEKCENGGNSEFSSGNIAFRRQTFIVIGTLMLTLGAGATAGFSAVLIPQLQETKFHGENFDTALISWVASISSLPLFCGNIMSGYLMERFGRRSCLIVLSIPFVLGWLIIGTAPNIGMILFGRFLTGFCQGWLGPLGPVFVGEISTPIYRGLFLAALSLAIALGILLSHLFGTFIHWSFSSVLCGIFPLVGGIILYYAPESPSWLASKGRIDECVKSYEWYRGTKPETKMELEKMIAEKLRKDTGSSKDHTLAKSMKKPEFWKPLLIMITFFVVTQLSGVNVICAYTTSMMKALIGNEKNAYAAMLGIDVLRCVSLFVACVLLRRLGRRPMAIFSGVCTAISLIALAAYLYMLDFNVISHLSPYVSLGLMAFYMIVSNLGIVPLPWNMVGELFATSTKGIGSGISVMMTSLTFFATVKTAPALFESIGYHGTYLFYGISTLLGTLFLIIWLPETKGKTLLEVEEYFRHGKTGKTKESELARLAHV